MQMQEPLGSRLEQQVQRHSNLSNADDTVLVVLSETPGMRRRIYEPGQLIGWEKSRLNHQLTRMGQRRSNLAPCRAETARSTCRLTTDEGIAFWRDDFETCQPS